MTEIIGNAFKYGYKVGDIVSWKRGADRYKVLPNGNAKNLREESHIGFANSPDEYSLVQSAEYVVTPTTKPEPMTKFEVGDKVRHKDDNDYIYTVSGVNEKQIKIEFQGYSDWYDKASFYNLSLAPTTKTTKPDGGPSSYYDFPFQEWTTVNDMIEYLAAKQWGKHSWIFKDIVKACTRWGSKDGTTEAYDAKKIIYYGLRLLMSVSDKATVQAYLKQLQEDKQFK